MATSTVPTGEAPLVRRASLSIEPAAPTVAADKARPEPARAVARPTRAAALLDEKTLRDIGSAARDEQGVSRD